jgi:putative oxidoreductase
MSFMYGQLRGEDMKPVTMWILTIVASAMFLLAGTLKLVGVPMEVELFAAIGIGQWFRLLTGVLEIGGALLLLAPVTAAFGALVLATVMVGAIVTHLFIVGGNPLVPIALLAITIAIAYLRREQISSRLVNG